jgi:hypothetical protein
VALVAATGTYPQGEGQVPVVSLDADSINVSLWPLVVTVF